MKKETANACKGFLVDGDIGAGGVPLRVTNKAICISGNYHSGDILAFHLFRHITRRAPVSGTHATAPHLLLHSISTQSCCQPTHKTIPNMSYIKRENNTSLWLNKMCLAALCADNPKSKHPKIYESQIHKTRKKKLHLVFIAKHWKTNII